MNTRTAAFVTTIAMLLIAPGVTWAQASTEPVEGTIEDLVTIPGISWVDEDGILHVRNQITEQKVQGDIVGDQVVTISLNVNLGTGEGDLHGSFELTNATAVRLGLTGSFEGRFDGLIVGGSSIFSVNGPRGSGDFDGMKMRVTGQNPAGSADPTTYSGQILSPKGF